MGSLSGQTEVMVASLEFLPLEDPVFWYRKELVLWDLVMGCKPLMGHSEQLSLDGAKVKTAKLFIFGMTVSVGGIIQCRMF